MNLPLSRRERVLLGLFRKPVLWALMVCTSGAALMMVDGIAQTQLANQPASMPKSTPSDPVAANGPASSAILDKASDDARR
jgi:hypothetical protein